MKTNRLILLILSGTLLLTNCKKSMSGEYISRPDAGLPPAVYDASIIRLSFDDDKKATMFVGAIGLNLSYEIKEKEIKFTKPNGEFIVMTINPEGTITYMDRTLKKK